MSARIEVHLVTPERWRDVARLFGTGSNPSDCWCGFWRLPRKEWRAMEPDDRKADLRRVVKSGEEPGLLAYVDGEPAGWCAVQPRAEYVALLASRTLSAPRNEGVWAITCFFIAPAHRGAGVMRALVAAAIERARASGARALEAYPRTGRRSNAEAYMGVADVFEKAGFRVVGRPTKARLVMRRGFRRKIP